MEDLINKVRRGMEIHTSQFWSMPSGGPSHGIHGCGLILGSHACVVGLLCIDVQPLLKRGVPLTPTARGAAWLNSLFEHGRKRASELLAVDAAAAEEVEREIEQEEEREQETEVDTVAPVMQAAGEKDWANPEEAMQLASVSDMEQSQGVTVGREPLNPDHSMLIVDR